MPRCARNALELWLIRSTAGPIPGQAAIFSFCHEVKRDIPGDLSRRRGEIRGVTTDGFICAIEAEVPLQNLFGYAMDIRSLSKSRADYSVASSRYAVLPVQPVS